MNNCFGVIFSKDRALQLDGCLRSYLLNAGGANNIRLNVLFTASDQRGLAQYTQLAQEISVHNQVTFIHENDFRTDFLGIILDSIENIPVEKALRTIIKAGPTLRYLIRLWPVQLLPDYYILFLVDDTIFTHPFRIEKVLESLAEHPQALGFSLRLGRNTTYCYSKDAPQTIPPNKLNDQGIFLYDWPSAEFDFKYPLEVSSSIYRLRDILPILFSNKFSNPNILENRMASSSSHYAKRLPEMLCFQQSVAFSCPINKVQKYYPNRSGANPSLTADQLKQAFDDGWRVDIETYRNFSSNGCHQEVDLILKQR